MKPFIEDLTVFVIYSGEDIMSECIDSLNKQTCCFKIEVIKDITPMSCAFQRMPDICRTKFFIQVDADMVLYKDSVMTLYKKIKNTLPFVYRVYGQLYEEGFGLGGSIKCWKKSIFKFFKFQDVRTVDRDFHNRVKKFGFYYKPIKKVLGSHRPRYSNFSLYLKTKSDIEKWRFLKRDPSLYAIPLFEELSKSNGFNFYKFFGFVCGAITPKKFVEKSKNMTRELYIFNELEKLIFEKNTYEFVDFDFPRIINSFIIAYQSDDTLSGLNLLDNVFERYRDTINSVKVRDILVNENLNY